MTFTMIRKILELPARRSLLKLDKIFFHVDSPFFMVRQNNIENSSLAMQKLECVHDLIKHSFLDKFNFPWSEISVHQSDKSTFAS